MFIYLTASKISHNLTYPPEVNTITNEFLRRAIQKGRIIHSRLGFINSEIFKRYLKLDGDLILVSGMPDLIVEDEVQELKTYHTPASKKKNEEVARIQLQVYSFVTGLKKQRIIMFHTYTNKKEEIEAKYNAKEFKEIMRKAVKLEKLIKGFKKEFAAIKR